MTVYVDQPRHRLGRMVMCHMAADTLEELHAMAVTLGVAKHFQNKPGAPHYDICKANRTRAIALGATHGLFGGFDEQRVDRASAQRCQGREARMRLPREADRRPDGAVIRCGRFAATGHPHASVPMIGAASAR